MTPLEELTREAAETQDALLRERGHLTAVRTKLLARPRRINWKLVCAVTSPLAVAVVVAALLASRQPAPLTISASGAPVLTGQWLSAGDSEPLLTRFSDGTSVALLEGSTGRVEAVDSRGAHVVLERGRAQIDVMARENSSWEFHAGPFELVVIGTRFVVGWDATRKVFHLSTEEGSVRVTGPGLTGRTVSAGEVVTVWLSGRETVVRTRARRGTVDDVMPGEPSTIDALAGNVGAQHDGAEGQAAVATAEDSTHDEGEPSSLTRQPEPPALSEDPEVREPATGEGVDEEREEREMLKVAPSSSWDALAREGRYTEALAAVDSAGWDEVLASGTAGQLLLLGDAARLGGRSDRATEAYLKARQRFPGSEAAASSAFRLGRQSFDHDAAPGRAARWFATYISERPAGRYAQESLGRLIEARLRSSDRDGARSAARDYLARFPSGPHAQLARSVIEE